MSNHVCDILDIVKETYKFGYYCSIHKKNLKVYEVVTSCPICNEVSVWWEYRHYVNNFEFKICDCDLIRKGE